MEELKEYQKRMGYDKNKMKSMKYKMTVYDEFLKEYEYRKRYCGVKENIQKSGGTGNDDFSKASAG